MLTVAVLGPVELRRDGARLALPAGRTTEVLVRLALEAGRVVRAERLIEDLWGAAAASTGRNTLQSKVSQLRRALGEPGLVASGNGGYTLELDPGNVDAVRVVALAAVAAGARRDGDLAAALAAATEGLALFRGEVLADAGDGEWLHPHRVRLEELRLGLLEDKVAARVALGSGGDLVADLEGLVRQHPLREELWSSLISALYRAGRQADALAAYGRVRTMLVDELGVEPGPGLRALERQILRQSPTLATAAPPELSTVGNLPALSSGLVGRTAEVAAVPRLLADHRLVTLVGPAGVGKTRLALEVARELRAPGGVWLVRLDAADAASAIGQMVAETLQLPGEPQLLDRVRSASTVLVLDNCEHVVDAVADLTGRLLAAGPALRVLATSQLPLGVDGELVSTVEPLSIADSVALFASRAVDLRRQFVLDDQTTAVVTDVCRSLDGLPLAIELAAARVRSLSIQEIARRLDDRLTLLRDPTSRRPERRRALAAAIGWSYDLLFPDDQQGLAALACFAGGAPLAAAEHVAAALGVPRSTVVDVIGRLVDRSLVGVDIADDGAVRYRLLDSIRAFALDRLAAAGQADVAAAAHAVWFADLGDLCAATVRGPGQAGCLAAVRANRANIDAALAWSAEHDPPLGLRIANGFGSTWIVLGDGVAGAARLRAALVALKPEPGDATARATGLLLAGWLEASAGDVAQAERDLDAARALAAELADEGLLTDTQRHLAFLRIQQGRPHDVLALAQASLAGYERLGRPWGAAASRLLAAFGAIMLGDTASAAEAAGEAVWQLGPIGDSWGLVHAEGMLGAVAQAEHRFDDAARSLARAAATAEQLGFLGQAALHLTTLGRIRQRAGDPGAASDTLHRAIAAARRSGDLRIAATARGHLARLARAAGRTDEAVRLLTESDRWYRSAGGGDGALLARCQLAALESTVDTLRAVLDEAGACDDREVQVLTLDALARIAAEHAALDEAADLLRRADEAFAAARHVIDEADRFDARTTRALLTVNPT
jgi:predicted ATPase/DNA-binding SARP family transcriptional activator